MAVKFEFYKEANVRPCIERDLEMFLAQLRRLIVCQLTVQVVLQQTHKHIMLSGSLDVLGRPKCCQVNVKPSSRTIEPNSVY